MTPIEFLVGIVASSLSIACAFSKPRRHAGPIFIEDAFDNDDPIAVPAEIVTPAPSLPLMLCSMPECGAMTPNRMSLVATDGTHALEISMCPSCFALAAARNNPIIAATLRAWGTNVAIVKHEDTGATL